VIARSLSSRPIDSSLLLSLAFVMQSLDVQPFMHTNEQR
jgi:hypothetical protein